MYRNIAAVHIKYRGELSNHVLQRVLAWKLSSTPGSRLGLVERMTAIPSGGVIELALPRLRASLLRLLYVCGVELKICDRLQTRVSIETIELLHGFTLKGLDHER